MCASPQITNLQIFMDNPQINKLSQNTAQLCLKTGLKIVFVNVFYIQPLNEGVTQYSKSVRRKTYADLLKFEKGKP